MKLLDWLEREGVSFAAFGVTINRTGEAVRRYAGGERIPDRETMPRIVEATSGQVTANDFFDIPASLHNDSDLSGGACPVSPDNAGANIEDPEPSVAPSADGTSGRTSAPAASNGGGVDASAGPDPDKVPPTHIRDGLADELLRGADHVD